MAYAERALRLPVALAVLWLAAACFTAAAASPFAQATPAAVVSTSPSPTPATTPAAEYTRTTKVSLIKALPGAPQLVILGSSRAMRIDPDRVRSLTGYAGFNASVTSGSIADAYCFARFIRDWFPGSTQGYIWLVDVEQFRLDTLREGTLGQPELAQYLPDWALAASAMASAVKAGTSTSAAPSGTPEARYGNEAVWLPNGYLLWNRWDYLRLHGRTLKKGIAQSVRKYRLIYPRQYTRLCSLPRRMAEETVQLMNEWGVQPVIVLSPYHPALLSRIARRGADARRAAVVAFFKGLQAQGLRLRLLDMTRIASFGGWRTGFYDGTHMNAKLSAQLMRKVVRLSREALP